PAVVPLSPLSLHDALPILISGMRLSSTKPAARSVPASLNRKKMSGKPPARRASLQIFIEAIAESGVLGEGFQMQMSPQTPATKADRKSTRLNSSHVKSSYA